MKIRHTKLRTNQEGMVSIIVAVLIMLLLTLIVLAMAQNSRREQRQALDRQLSSQAFYNAESGINDTLNYLRSTPNTDEQWSQCDTFKSKGLNSAIGGNGTGQSYSCLLYDQTPPELHFDQVRNNEAESMPVESATGAGIQNLTIEWEAKDLGNPGGFSGCPALSASGAEFPAAASNSCDAGVLRVELINTTNLDRDALKSSNYVAFFVPQENGVATANYSDANSLVNQGKIVGVDCDPNAKKRCKVTINGIPGIPTMHIVLVSRYKDSSVSVTGQTVGNLPLQFRNGQVVIDSTGKASDVLKRLLVRVPVQQNYSRTPFTIQSNESICKLISVTPDTAAVNGCTPPAPSERENGVEGGVF